MPPDKYASKGLKRAAYLSETARRMTAADCAGIRVGIVAARWNFPVTEKLLYGARAALASVGIDLNDRSRCILVWVPGAFEIPIAVAKVIELERVHAVVALGCVVRGDTDHYHYVASAASYGLQEVSLRTGVPVAFGVLTTYDMDQALARAADSVESNKGFEAATAALEMILTLRELGGSDSKSIWRHLRCHRT